MRKLFTLMLAVILLVSTQYVSAQTVEEEESPFSMTVTLNSDIFFGFYPFFAGSYDISETTAFTFYGILWSGGTGAAWGNWTEFGVGMSFAPNEAITITPQIGLLNGSLTSGLGTPVLGEGIVPNLTVGLGTDKLEGEFYLGYYLGIDHGNPNTNNYLHWWLNGGVKFGKFISAGLHMEQLRFAGGKNYADDAPYNYYVALGPYVQFSAPNGGAFARFTGAADLRNDDDEIAASAYDPSTFFKLTVGYSF